MSKRKDKVYSLTQVGAHKESGSKKWLEVRAYTDLNKNSGTVFHGMINIKE